MNDKHIRRLMYDYTSTDRRNVGRKRRRWRNYFQQRRKKSGMAYAVLLMMNTVLRKRGGGGGALCVRGKRQREREHVSFVVRNIEYGRRRSLKVGNQYWL